MLFFFIKSAMLTSCSWTSLWRLFRTSYFHRWKDGSCIEVSPVKYDKAPGAPANAAAQGHFDFEASTSTMPMGTKPAVGGPSSQEVEHIYTFFDDIRYIPEIHELGGVSQTSVQNTINNMKKFLLKFRNYKNLWRTDKVSDGRFRERFVTYVHLFSWLSARNSSPRTLRSLLSMKKWINTRRVSMR